MSVAFGGTVVIPYVCGVYTCECGRRQVRHGRRAGSLPRGWEVREAGRHLCAACCEKRDRSARLRT